MAQYKTIAGPIGLKIEGGEDYETAVKKYAGIIDAEAVGGWDLLCIQQIPVAKAKVNIGNILTAALLIGAIGYAMGKGEPAGAAFGALIGGVAGFLYGKSYVIEFFNMLVFTKKQ